MRGLTSYFILHTSYFLLGVGAAAQGPVTLGQHIEPLLKEFCYDCHNPKKHKGDLDLEGVAANGKPGDNREVWEKVIEALEARDMPPEKKPQPALAQRELMINFLDAE